jgi:hypothetical protein
MCCSYVLRLFFFLRDGTATNNLMTINHQQVTAFTVVGEIFTVNILEVCCKIILLCYFYFKKNE